MKDEHDQAVEDDPFKGDGGSFEKTDGWDTDEKKTEKTEEYGRDFLEGDFDKNKIEAPKKYDQEEENEVERVHE